MASNDDAGQTLLELAIDAHDDLAKLATGLAHAGASPQAVEGLQGMVTGLAKLAKILGTGQVGAQSAPGAGGPEPPAGPPATHEVAAPANAGPPTAQAPMSAPQGMAPGERGQGTPQGVLHAATQHLAAAARIAGHTRNG